MVTEEKHTTGTETRNLPDQKVIPITWFRKELALIDNLLETGKYRSVADIARLGVHRLAEAEGVV